ncbi:hypothetical protein [Roseofilum casamattae]|uniref:Uncharacterized protein n=1 Tax=Roseofilum casamattae BLCC-M143 TaxID=3022442 RepID=A0ABT7C0X9_9CYAN|nr:hypothetical protein [Roseofilum casamattae]MDJ1184717.1 hypothetical protein [Roseofilum casamattae BLCC-M143]
MNKSDRHSGFQDLIEKVETFSLEDREILIDILQKRISEQKRLQLAREVAEVREDYRNGKVFFGTVDDFLEQLDNE